MVVDNNASGDHSGVVDIISSTHNSQFVEAVANESYAKIDSCSSISSGSDKKCSKKNDKNINSSDKKNGRGDVGSNTTNTTTTDDIIVSAGQKKSFSSQESDHLQEKNVRIDTIGITIAPLALPPANDPFPLSSPPVSTTPSCSEASNSQNNVSVVNSNSYSTNTKRLSGNNNCDNIAIVPKAIDICLGLQKTCRETEFFSFLHFQTSQNFFFPNNNLFAYSYCEYQLVIP